MKEARSPKGRRTVRHRRIRAKLAGSANRPRLAVFRSSKHLQMQLIDDSAGRTLWGSSDQGIRQKGAKTERARRFGTSAAKKILAAGIRTVVFDRSGYAYQGRIKALAEALRKAGLEF